MIESIDVRRCHCEVQKCVIDILGRGMLANSAAKLTKELYSERIVFKYE